MAREDRQGTTLCHTMCRVDVEEEAVEHLLGFILNVLCIDRHFVHDLFMIHCIQIVGKMCPLQIKLIRKM